MPCFRCIESWFRVNRSCPEHPTDWRMLTSYPVEWTSLLCDSTGINQWHLLDRNPVTSYVVANCDWLGSLSQWYFWLVIGQEVSQWHCCFVAGWQFKGADIWLDYIQWELYGDRNCCNMIGWCANQSHNKKRWSGSFMLHAHAQTHTCVHTHARTHAHMHTHAIPTINNPRENKCIRRLDNTNCNQHKVGILTKSAYMVMINLNPHIVIRCCWL